MGSDNLFHKNKIRTTKELARKKAKKAPYETICIICEDKKSACYYFKEFINHLRLNTANFIIPPSHGSAPISVVDSAIQIAQTKSDIDYIFCVFDRDQHESYERAQNKLNLYKPKRTAKSKPKFTIITCTPCFELWLLLHFKYTTKFYEKSGDKTAADHLIKDLCKELPNYNKNTVNWFHDLKNKFETAINHAKRLASHNIQTKSINPATNMHELIEYLINLKDKKT